MRGCPKHTLGMSRTLDLQSLLPGAAGIRVTDDIPPLLWAVDVVIAITGKGRGHAADCLRDLSNDLFSSQKIGRKSMHGKGNGNVALVTFPDAIELIFALPGKVAKLVRKQAAGLFVEWVRDHTQDPALEIGRAHV